MSNSYNNTTKDNIKFNDTPVIVIDDFSVEANGSYTISRQNINKECEYLKLVCGLTSADKSLTTDFYGAVCVDYTIHYKDEDGLLRTMVDSFYPKYKHENNNSEDSTIISAPGEISYISITVTNNEDISVDISDFKVYISELVAEVTPEDVGDKLSQYYNNGGQTTLVIPLVQTLPDVHSVPDGYICRLASIK